MLFYGYSEQKFCLISGDIYICKKIKIPEYI